jgi:hypothetical protein
MTESEWNSGTPDEPAGPGPGSQDAVDFGPSSGAPVPAPRRRRLLVAVSAAVVAAVAVAAIAIAATGGSGKAPLTPRQVLTAAVHKSATFSSESATFSEQLSGLASGTITGSVQAIRSPLQMSMGITESIAGQTIPITAVLTGSTMYMKFGKIPGMPRQIIGKWLALPLSSLGGGAISSLLQTAEKQNPASQAQLLLASKHVRAAGTQVVDGVPTTKYVGSFTPAAALKVLTPSQRAVLGPAMKQISGQISFTVWIDGSDQVRRISEVETVGSEQVHVSYTYVSFNQPVKITIPPASQVLHIPASALNG